MMLLVPIFFCLGFGLVAYSGFCFLFNKIIFCGISYLLACFCMVLAYRSILQRSFLHVEGLFCLLLGCICFFVPLFGILITLVIVLLMAFYSTKTHDFADKGDEAINLNKILPFYPQYGAGGVTLHLLQEDAPTLIRTKALFALRQSPLSQVNELIYQLLPDRSDELRLLAFNLLEGQESVMSKRIHTLVCKLANDPKLDRQGVTACHKELALLYWDLIYYQLISKELEASIIEKARASALCALEEWGDDALLWAVLAKIYTHEQAYTLAQRSFEKA